MKETEESRCNPTTDLLVIKQSLDVLAREINTKVKERDAMILRQLDRADDDAILKPFKVYAHCSRSNARI